MKKSFITAALVLAAYATSYAEEPVPLHYQRASLFETMIPDSTSVVFLGNSLTHGCEWHELLGMPNALNRGVNGDTTEDIANRLGCITAGRPAKIFLLAGVNDVSHDLPAEKVAADVLALVDRIRHESPQTKLYLQSLLPINNSFGRYSRMYGKEETIRQINELLAMGAKKRGVTFINLYPRFCDKDGNLRSDLTNDGLHLLGRGYLIWKQALLPYLGD
ncbi:MAG: hypothetical protein J6J93_04990 [Muribaculaceae bacterium]|nr:hypothetical protein [Muribaculaceae bacterium]